MVLKVKEPLDGEWQRLQPGKILFTYLHLAAARRADARAGGNRGDLHCL